MDKKEQDELLHVATCMRAALLEMIQTFEQRRFGGAYPKCLERSREALNAGSAVLDRPAKKPRAMDGDYDHRAVNTPLDYFKPIR